MQKYIVPVIVIFSLLLFFYALAVMWLLLDVQFSKVKKKNKEIFLILLTAVIAVHIFAIARYGASFYATNYPILAQIPAFLLFYLISPYRGAKILFACLTAVVMSSPIMFIAVMAQVTFGATALQAAVIRVIAYSMMLFWIKKVLCPPVHYMMRNRDEGWLQFCIIPAIYYVITYTSGNYNFFIENDAQTLIVRVGLLLLAFAAYFLILKIFRQTHEKMELENQQNILKIQTAAAQNQIDQLAQEQEKIRHLQHDLRHHAQMMAAFLQEGDIKQAQQYLDTIERQRQSFRVNTYCHNNTVNLILSSFAAKAKQRQVDFSAQIKAADFGSISDCDICVILSNALENAVRCAAQNKDPQNRTVSVEMFCKNKKNCINVANPFEGTVTIENGMPQTSQKNHGTGTRSIAAICEKYNGICRFQMQNGVFSTSVVL